MNSKGHKRPSTDTKERTPRQERSQPKPSQQKAQQ